MTLVEISLYIALPLLVLAILLSLTRLAIGPRLPDRVVALDLLSTYGIGIIAIYAIATDERAFLDVAAVVALISFLGTVAFAYYLEKRG